MKIYYIFDNLEIHKIDDLKQEINIFIHYAQRYRKIKKYLFNKLFDKFRQKLTSNKNVLSLVSSLW